MSWLVGDRLGLRLELRRRALIEKSLKGAKQVVKLVAFVV